MVTPLRKRKDGTGPLYRRRDTVEAILGDLLTLDRDVLLARCAIRSARDPNMVPSECLVHLVRACRDDNSDAWFNRLWPILLQRVRDRIPRVDGADGRRSASRLAVRDQIEGRFMELIAADREEYHDGLDYFEINFEGAMAMRRLDAQKPVWREERRNRPLENQERPGEMSSEVEAAIGQFDPFIELIDEDDRLRLDAAIEALPAEQIRIMEMLRLEIPMDSKEAYAITIAKTLGRSEKTIRLWRDKAFSALRQSLEKDGQ